MNKVETARVLGYLSAAWPAVMLPDESVAVWSEHLAHVDYDLAKSAAKRIVATNDRFPAVGEFLSVVRAMTPRLTYAEMQTASERLALPAPVASRDEAMSAIASARDALAARYQDAVEEG